MRVIVEVRQYVEVEVDESKFTDEFMEDFRGYMYDFDSVDDHMIHLAQLDARGIDTSGFIEGYGPSKDMGIRVNVESVVADVFEILT